jgi:tRNA(Arg) A34 adenosine deaminase TadA
MIEKSENKSTNMPHKDYMKCAFDEALIGMNQNEGGPFGTVIVLNNEIIGRGRNRVLAQNDPTAHAEIVAIRDACKTMQSFHLKDAVLYTNCEPCPMCLAAIYWANIKNIYYCYDRYDAANIGFSDQFIYDELARPIDERNLNIKKIEAHFPVDLFKEWQNKQDRTTY